jgi:hypothetical protein
MHTATEVTHATKPYERVPQGESNSQSGIFSITFVSLKNNISQSLL